MELKLAVRRLFARPAYTALLVLIVGVGIGAATTVFSLVDQLLLRRAPFAYADRLVDVLDTNRKSGGGGSSLTPQKIVGWQAQPALFERFESYAPATFDVTGDGEPERIDGLRVSVGLFQMLGVEPRLGRSFTTGDGLPGGERTAIISEDLWRRRYGAQPDALGRAIALNEQDYTIVGVMPRRFKLLMGKEAVWVPVDLAASTGDATLTSFYGVGRLARGVIMTDAQRTADQLADRLNQASPIARSWDLSLRQKNVARVDPTTRTALLVLLGAVSFVLFITCANVANLFLSAAPLRLREMAIRSALGSGRARLIRSVLLESVLVAVAGGALGVLLANWGVQAVLAASPDRLASLATTTVEVDGRVIAVAISLTLLTGIIVGLLPALRGSRGNLEMTLRGSSPAARSSYGRAPSLLVVFEVAFSVVLLIGAALMARTMANLESIEPGFKAEGLIGLHVDLPTDRYPDVVARGAFFDGVVDRLKATPGILDVTVATGVPPSQGGFSFGPLEGEGSSARPARAIIPFNTISESYFRTLQIPLLAGRTFTRDDDASVAIVSKGFADRVFPGMDAVGRRYRIGAGNWRTIVGIAANVEARAAGEERTDLMMYYPWVRKPAATSTATATPPQPRRRSYDWRLLIVRASDPSAALPDIKRQIWAVDSHQAIDRVALVADTYAEAFGRQRFVLRLMTVFSLIALGLTAAGIFGVLSQVVARRTREIGIRMALGARPGDVLGHVLRGGLALAALGAAVGCAAAFGLTRVLRTLLFGVSPTDPVSFAGVAILLVAVALIACWWPARSAMRVEPATALRVE